MVDYFLEHFCDHVVDREPGLYHLADVPMLVVLEQVDDEQHPMDVVPLFAVLVDYLLGHDCAINHLEQVVDELLAYGEQVVDEMLAHDEQVVDELVAHDDQFVAVDNLACKMFLIVVLKAVVVDYFEYSDFDVYYPCAFSQPTYEDSHNYNMNNYESFYC